MGLQPNLLLLIADSSPWERRETRKPYCWCGSAEAGAGPVGGLGNSALPSSPNTSRRGFIGVFVVPWLTPGLGVPPEPPISAMYCLLSMVKVIGGPILLRNPVGVSKSFSPFSAEYAISRPSGETWNSRLLAVLSVPPYLLLPTGTRHRISCLTGS